ncbi:hypothetical protein AVEN_119319-1 [Araneus ventricosus]|uniref:Tc1-like transposase DDE domain-containing protein n=1 Tax=Araneus ventricosus TaxID=182803 RepID=A0A4Y2RWU2_ARAVE|nr:hypothetical protein AVEN_119319-1 [Araneus ventricosus]
MSIVYSEGLSTMQDNATPHASRLATKWLQEHSSDFRHFHWPAKSPEMNIIEDIRDALLHVVENRSPTPRTPMDLWTVLKDEWCELPPRYLQTLVESIPHRVAALLCVFTVLGEHGIGASMILVGVALYQYFMGGIWWYLPGASKTDRYIKLGFIVIYTILFLLTVYPLPVMILELLGPNLFDFAGWKKVAYDLPRVYSVSHLICSICEYSICILSAINIGLLFKDLQKVSLRVVLRHKSCTTEAEEPAPSIKLETIS